MLLDTNVLVRHFTGDPPAQARRATAFLTDADDLVLTDVVIAETAYMLESFYRAPREIVATHLRAAVDFPAIDVDDPDVVHRTLELYELGLHFAEAYVAARAEESGRAVASFDRSLDRISTVRRVEP